MRVYLLIEFFFKVGSKMKKAIYFEIGEEEKYW